MQSMAGVQTTNAAPVWRDGGAATKGARGARRPRPATTLPGRAAKRKRGPAAP